MKQYWKEQLERYPNMQIQDFMKFIYQATLGPAHLITDKLANYQYLLKEYYDIQKDKNHALIEEISDEYARIHLEALPKELLPSFHELFIKSCKAKESNESFIKELTLVESEIEKENLTFDLQKWKQSLKEYERMNYPMVSHTDTFKELYHPHYRVIRKEYLEELNQLINKGEFYANQK